jgi:hypothetical protein
MAITMFVLFGLLLCLGATAIRRTALPASGLLIFSALWLPADSKLEGPVLVVLSYSNGITLADLLAAFGAAVAGIVLIRIAWRASAPANRAWNVATVVGSCWSILALGALASLSR